MPPIAQDRLIRKEVALGTIREQEPPQQHIGTRIVAPWLEVATDDVIFDYARGLTDGMAPARAEDAESELAQKDLLLGGTGRASVIDWALKDHYTASDVMRYREALLIQGALNGVNGVSANGIPPVTIEGTIAEFRSKIARDDLLRRRKLDNRVEWLIMRAIEDGQIVYNDGKIKFTVAFGRPSNQQNQAPAGGLWSSTTSDPIGDIKAIQEYMYNLYGVRMTRAITSRRVLNSIMNSDRFAARTTGMVVGGTPNTPIDPNYIVNGWGPNMAQQILEAQTNMQFVEYDAVYRTRPVGSQVVTNHRFLSDNKIYFLPDPADVDELDDMIGFGRTLTSPHPEGNWQPGFYEWERETVDPWGLDRGTGVKAFPLFPHLEWTYTMSVLAP